MWEGRDGPKVMEEREEGRSHYGGETRERGKRDGGGEEGPKGRKKTLKSGRNCRRRSSFNNALLRQKRGGNDSGEGRRSPTFPLDSRHHRNFDRRLRRGGRPRWRWDRGEREGLSLSSLFGFGVSVRNWRPGGNHRRREATGKGFFAHPRQSASNELT